MDAIEQPIGEAAPTAAAAITEEAICEQVQAAGEEVTPEVRTFAGATVMKILLLFRSQKVPDKEGIAQRATQQLANWAADTRRAPERTNDPNIAKLKAIGRAALAVRDAAFRLLCGKPAPHTI